MNRNYFIVAAAAGLIGFTTLAADGNYDFEKSVNGSLPKGYRQIKDRWCGGTFEIVNDECGEFKKALKLVKPEEKKVVRILMDRPRIPAKTGDQVVYEFSAKGNGALTIGYYAYNQEKSMREFNSTSAKIDSAEWKKVTLKLTVKKPGIVEISPFFQSADAGMVISNMKVSVSTAEK